MDTILSKLDQIPCMILNQNADIIDTNSMSESCLREIASKTLLFHSINSTDRLRLCDFCKTPILPLYDDLSYVKNTALFEIQSRRIKFGFARKTAHFTGPLTEMYLFEDKHKLFDPTLPFSSRLPYIVFQLDTASRYIKKHLIFYGNYSNNDIDTLIGPLLSQITDNNLMFIEYLKNLYSTQKVNTTNEIINITNSLLNKIASRSDLIYSKINYEENVTDNENNDFMHSALCMDTGSYIYILTLLIASLNTATDSYKINVKLHRFSNNIEVILSTQTSAIPVILNNTSDIVSLSPYIPGSYFKLSLAFYIASSQNYRLNTFFSPTENILGFSLGCMPDYTENLDFKYRDPMENFSSLLNEALNIIKK